MFVRPRNCVKVIPLHFVYPQAWRDAGLPISTTSNECAKLYDVAVSQVLSVRLEQKSRIIFNSSKSVTGKRQEISCSFPIYHTLFFCIPPFCAYSKVCTLWKCFFISQMFSFVQMFGWTSDETIGGTGGAIKAMLEADPNFGKCFFPCSDNLLC